MSSFPAPPETVPAPYEAASQGRRLELWQPYTGGPNEAVRATGDVLRARTRDSVRNDPYGRAALLSLVSNIVGRGFRPLFRDERASKLWDRWTRQADIAGQLDFAGLVAQAVGGMVESGESFVRLLVDPDARGVPLRLAVLESDLCPIGLTKPGVRNGIEFQDGRRVAYHIYQEHPDETGIFGSRGLSAALRIPASEICHLHDSTMARPGTLRGTPWLSTALLRLYNLHRYDDAELERKKTAALFAGFLRRPIPSGVSLDEARELWGDVDAVNDALDVTLEPGTIQVLGPGEEVSIAAPADLDKQYLDFQRQQLRAIASSMGILYEQLTGDYSLVNDRTYRAAVNEFRRLCTIWQHNVVIQKLCDPILQRWVDLAVIAGLLPDDPGLRDVRWMTDGWSYLNPVQDVQAKREEVRSGFRSRSDVVAESGADAAEIDAEIAADNARADALGLRFDSDGRRTDKQGAAQQRMNLNIAVDTRPILPSAQGRLERLPDGSTRVVVDERDTG